MNKNFLVVLALGGVALGSLTYNYVQMCQKETLEKQFRITHFASEEYQKIIVRMLQVLTPEQMMRIAEETTEQLQFMEIIINEKLT